MSIDVSIIPEQYQYIRQAAARYGHLNSHEPILAFLQSKTEADIECLNEVAAAIVSHDHMDAICDWIREALPHESRSADAVSNLLALIGELGISCHPNYAAMDREEARHKLRDKWQTCHPHAACWLAHVSRPHFNDDETRRFAVEMFHRCSSKDKYHVVLALYDFPNQENVALIEEWWSKRPFVRPPYEAWGFLAALSFAPFKTLQKWLQAGPPLSFIALDALHACYRYDGYQPLEVARPKLHGCDSGDELNAELRAHMLSADNQLERRRTGILLRHVDEIVAIDHFRPDP